jgi:anti-sigma B factor antagonist
MSHQPRFFRRQSFDGFVVVFVDGEIDVAVAGVLAEELEATIDDCSPAMLVDLTNVTFMDSSALSTLIRVHKYAGSHGGGIRLVGPNARVSRLLEITHLDHVLPVHDTIEAAAEGLQPPELTDSMKQPDPVNGVVE